MGYLKKQFANRLNILESYVKLITDPTNKLFNKYLICLKVRVFFKNICFIAGIYSFF